MKVNILSHSVLKFKEYWKFGLIELISKVVEDTINKSGLRKEEIDLLLLGNCFYSLISEKSNLQSEVENRFGIKTLLFSGSENCTGIAINHAHKLIEKGIYNNILVVAGEKLSDLTTASQEKDIASILDCEKKVNGFTYPSIFSLLSIKYMKDYGLSREDLAKVPVLSHVNGAKNKNAQFPFEITSEKVLKSSIICDPLHVLDSAAYSDGAAAILLSTKESKVSIIKSIYNHGKNLTCIQKVPQTFNEFSFSMKDIDVMEIYDNFSITTLVSLEKLGFSESGKGIKFLEEKSKSINPSGGLKVNGNAFSVNVIRQLIEVTEQLSGNCGDRQIINAKIGLTQSLGVMDSNVVNILMKNG